MKQFTYIFKTYQIGSEMYVTIEGGLTCSLNHAP